MNPIDALIVKLAAVKAQKQRAKQVELAATLDVLLREIELRFQSVRDREEAMGRMLEHFDRTAVVRMANFLGLHNLARIARRVIREEMVA